MWSHLPIEDFLAIMQVRSYWQGDGFSCEGAATDYVFKDCVAYEAKPKWEWPCTAP